MTPVYIREGRVKSLINEKMAFKLALQVFRGMASGAARMPSKIYLSANELGSDFRAMPALVEHGSLSSAGIKWVSVFPGNRKKGLPTVNGTIFLNSTRTGELLAIVEANTITALRTGAAAAVASYYLARRNSRKLAIVGAGLQGEYQLRALVSLFKFDEIRVWGFLPGEADAFCKRLKPFFKNLTPCTKIASCVWGADIITTCTPSRIPLLKKEWVSKGCHINAIGADAKGKEEIDPKILLSAKVVVDEWEQASHSGEINIPVSNGVFTRRNLHAELSQIASGKKKGRSNAKEITVFDSTGLAVLDIHFARYVYDALNC